MSKITAGEVAITLADDEVLTLRPTLKAATRINTRFGGFLPAMQQVGQMNMDAIVFIIGQGLGAADKEMKELPEKIWRAGVSDVAPDVIKFVRFLMNGGRNDDAGGEGSGEGNGG